MVLQSDVKYIQTYFFQQSKWSLIFSHGRKDSLRFFLNIDQKLYTIHTLGSNVILISETI